MSKERELASGGPGGSPKSDRRGSRRAARRPGPPVGETQVCSGSPAAARERPRNTLARTGRDRRDTVRLAGSVSFSTAEHKLESAGSRCGQR
jgi:hypothetical protein